MAALLGSELYSLNTEIRQGRQMNETTFYTLVNLAKDTFERMRPWRKLVKKDSSKSSTGATTHATSFALPTDFIMTLPRRPLRLVNASTPSDFIILEEVPWERWEEKKNGGGAYFTIDHANNLYYVALIVSGTYTHFFGYIATSTTITASTSWVFPAEYHPALAFEIAAWDQLGIDYDDLNRLAGNENHQTAQLIMRSAIKWDTALQRSSLGL